MLCASKDNHQAKVLGLHLIHGEASIVDEDEGSWSKVVVMHSVCVLLLKLSG